MDDLDDTLTNLAKPLSSATITVRVIKSFQYRVAKALVISDLDLTNTSVGELKERVKKLIQTQAGWKPYKSMQLSMKYIEALHQSTWGQGTNNASEEFNQQLKPLLPTDDDSVLLAAAGFENETEVSFFNRGDYDAFKASPEIKWD